MLPPPPNTHTHTHIRYTHPLMAVFSLSLTCMAIYWPTLGFKGRTFKLCVFNRWDFNFCICSSPLQDTLSQWRPEKIWLIIDTRAIHAGLVHDITDTGCCQTEKRQHSWLCFCNFQIPVFHKLDHTLTEMPLWVSFSFQSYPQGTSCPFAGIPL